MKLKHIFLTYIIPALLFVIFIGRNYSKPIFAACSTSPYCSKCSTIETYIGYPDDPVEQQTLNTYSTKPTGTPCPTGITTLTYGTHDGKNGTTPLDVPYGVVNVICVKGYDSANLNKTTLIDLTINKRIVFKKARNDTGYTDVVSSFPLGQQHQIRASRGEFPPQCAISDSKPALFQNALPTPTGSLSPTPAFPTGPWKQVAGGDIYQSSYTEPIPAGNYLLTDIAGFPNSTGVAWTGGSISLGSGTISSKGWSVSTSPNLLSNTYSYAYYYQLLKNKAQSVSNTTVGSASDLSSGVSIYYYAGPGPYTLDANLNTNMNTQGVSMAIFLINGTLAIPNNLTLDPSHTAVFIVSGGVNVDGIVQNVSGLYIVDGAFTIQNGSSAINVYGMVYAKNLSFQRICSDCTAPMYQFYYNAQFAIDLISIMGQSQVQWQEVGP